MLSLLDNTLLQGLAYGLSIVGVMLSFRILRYPDLTPDGSFLLGAATYAASISAGIPYGLAFLAAFSAGALAGMLTSLLNSHFRVNRLLTGILTTMIAYSIGFRILGGRPNVGLAQTTDIFDILSQLDSSTYFQSLHIHSGQLLVSLGIALLVAIVVLHLLQSEWGLLLRAIGSNRALVEELGRKPSRYQAQGLALANGIVGFSAAVISARQGFADINMGMGVVITFIAALVIGEELVRLAGIDPTRLLKGRIAGAFVGGISYFFLYLIILRASIREWIPFEITPTDLKMLSAFVVVAAVSLRNRSKKREEVLPF